MPEWWKTAKNILSGKAKGAKLILLGAFLIGVGIPLQIFYLPIQMFYGFVACGIFWGTGIIAFMSGVILYERAQRV